MVNFPKVILPKTRAFGSFYVRVDFFTSPGIFKARLHFGNDRSKLAHFKAQKIGFFNKP
jgi:hypothetical protein